MVARRFGLRHAEGVRPPSPGTRELRATIASSLQKPSDFEDRWHRLFDSCRPRRGLLGRREMVQVTPLPPRCQRFERALEMRILSEALAELLGDREIRGRLRLHPEPSLLDCDR